jgi:hypothetical protein
VKRKKYIGITEAARLFTLNRDWLMRWAKNDKMPHKRKGTKILIDPEECRAWMIANSKGSYKQTLYRAAEDEKPVIESVKKPNAEPSDLGIGPAVVRARTAEFEAFRKFVEARDGGGGLREEARLKLYVETCKALKELEKIFDDRQALEREIWEIVMAFVSRWIEPVKSLLDGMPRALAGRVNPQEPAFAETAMREWLNSQLLPMMAREMKP